MHTSDSDSHALLQQWTTQGYAVLAQRVAGMPLAPQGSDRPYWVAYRFFAHCNAHHLPHITATPTRATQVALVEVDFLTAPHHRLSIEGQHALRALLVTYTTVGNVSVDRYYSYARLVPLAALDSLMPQIVHLVETYTETTSAT